MRGRPRLTEDRLDYLDLRILSVLLKAKFPPGCRRIARTLGIRYMTVQDRFEKLRGLGLVKHAGGRFSPHWPTCRFIPVDSLPLEG